MAIKTPKYYAVRKGRKTGIFYNWPDCSAQVHQFPQAVYKSFSTLKEAEAFLAHNSSTPTISTTRTIEPHSPKLNSLIIPDSICVDASCLGNPGIMEYRGVHTSSGQEIFRSPVISLGTNNLGEFLAIVDGLIYLQEQGSLIPIYSDSKTALLWTAKRKVNTSLPANSQTREIWQLVDRALSWLNSHTYSNPLYKWDTPIWGEIPADFGRK